MLSINPKNTPGEPNGLIFRFLLTEQGDGATLVQKYGSYFWSETIEASVLMDTKSEADPGSPVDAGGVAIVRDDQFDFPSLLDAAKACRRSGGRLKVVDSGKLSPSELEWLGEAGADLYTSDLARPSHREIILMNMAARKGGGAAIIFHHGPFEPDEKERSVSFEALKEMGRSGVHIGVSNGRGRREFAALEELAGACVSGGTRLVYYHHGPLDPSLVGIARAGAFIHFAGSALQNEDDVVALCDLAKAALEKKGNVVLHIEGALALNWLSDIFDAGACVLFQTPPSDYRSPQKPFELRAERQAPSPRSYYLYPAFLL